MMDYKRDLNGKRHFFSISKKVHVEYSQLSVEAWRVVSRSNEKEIAQKSSKPCIKSIVLQKFHTDCFTTFLVNPEIKGGVIIPPGTWPNISNFLLKMETRGYWSNDNGWKTILSENWKNLMFFFKSVTNTFSLERD